MDEFQDTDGLQYEFVKLLAQHTSAVTIVGDPDQSIYGWRGAVRANLLTMQHDYCLATRQRNVSCEEIKALDMKEQSPPPATTTKRKGRVAKAKAVAAIKDEAKDEEEEVDKKPQVDEKPQVALPPASQGDAESSGRLVDMRVENADPAGAGGCSVSLLKETFRSSRAIVEAAQAVIEHDEGRPKRVLEAVQDEGTKPVLRQCDGEEDEAEYIAREVKRLVAYSGGMLNYEDFVVLIRIHALSRSVETAFAHHGIPCRIRGTVRFYERSEIKDIMSYMMLADNPKCGQHFTRAVQVPRRNVGSSTVAKITQQAEARGKSAFEHLEDVFAGKADKAYSYGPGVDVTLKRFVRVVQGIRALILKGKPISFVLKWLCTTIEYDGHLKKTEPAVVKRAQRIANVVELLTIATKIDGIKPKTVGRGSAASGFQHMQSSQEMPSLSQVAPNAGLSVHDAITRMLPGMSSKGDAELSSTLSASATEFSDPDKGLSHALMNWRNSISTEDEEDDEIEDDLEIIYEESPATALKADCEREEKALERFEKFLSPAMVDTLGPDGPDEENDRKSKVTISTGHSAKGLECKYGVSGLL